MSRFPEEIPYDAFMTEVCDNYRVIENKDLLIFYQRFAFENGNSFQLKRLLKKAEECKENVLIPDMKKAVGN